MYHSFNLKQIVNPIYKCKISLLCVCYQQLKIFLLYYKIKDANLNAVVISVEKQHTFVDYGNAIKQRFSCVHLFRTSSPFRRIY